MNGFLAGARDHYRTLQEAWNKNDLEKIREYVSPELFEHLKAERAELSGEQHTEVMYVDTQLVRADYGSDWAQVSVRFSGRYMDRQEQVEEDIRRCGTSSVISPRTMPLAYRRHRAALSTLLRPFDKGDLRVAFYCHRIVSCPISRQLPVAGYISRETC